MTDETTPIPTEPEATAHLPQLDHDRDGRPGGAVKAPSEKWVVTRAEGLICVPASRAKALIEAGARRATPRDFRIAGLDPKA